MPCTVPSASPERVAEIDHPEPVRRRREQPQHRRGPLDRLHAARHTRRLPAPLLSGDLRQRTYSVAIAVRTSRRAARRAGQAAASTPTSSRGQHRDAELQARDVQHRQAVVAHHVLDPGGEHDADHQPETSTPAARSRSTRPGPSRGPGERSIPIARSRPISRVRSTHAEQQGVDDAEHRDQHGQREQQVDGAGDGVDRPALRAGVRGLVPDLHQRVAATAVASRRGAAAGVSRRRGASTYTAESVLPPPIRVNVSIEVTIRVQLPVRREHRADL